MKLKISVEEFRPQMAAVSANSEMNAHTPAPWRFERETNTIRSVPANYWIATLDSWDSAVNHAANARLIAAAPELLAACELAESVMRCVPHESFPESLAALRSAITKARGEGVEHGN